MARIFKSKYPKMQAVRDADGKLLTAKKTATRGPNKGKPIVAQVREPVRDVDGSPVYAVSRKWSIEFTDVNGRRRIVPGYTDKAATKQRAAEIDRKIARQREGIFDVDFDQTDKAVQKHFEDWIADLTRAGRSPEYIRKAKSRVGRLLDELRWTTLSSIRPDKMTDWLGGQQRTGLGERTVNHYIEAATAFCNWCVAQQRLERNPLQQVSKARVVEPKVVRRAATTAELARLLEAAPERALVYIVAALTGLRRKELQLLEWRDVQLEGGNPHIVLRAVTTKSKRGDTIALNDEVSEWLQTARPTDAAYTDRVFQTMPTSTTFRSDLKRAGIPVEVDGKKLDFHALRTTLGTWLLTSGASIREAMEQMRHTDVRLTTKIYTDPHLVDMHRAVNSIPRITGSDPDVQTQRATGTYGRPDSGGQAASLSGPSDIRSDIGEEVSGRGVKCPQMAVLPDHQLTDETIVSASTTSTYDDSEDWRRGESNTRPATAPGVRLRVYSIV